MKRLAIIGSGELGQQVRHYAELDNNYLVVGFFDDYIEVGVLIAGLPILGKVEEVVRLYKENLFDCIFIAIGYKHLLFKKQLFTRLRGYVPFATIVANPAYIDSTATIGDGVILYPGCILDKNVQIEDNAILNLGVIISHDSRISHSTFCAPRVTVAGFSSIGECCFLGACSTIVDNVKIANNTVIGASALVLSDIDTESGTHIGVPARALN